MDDVVAATKRGQCLKNAVQERKGNKTLKESQKNMSYFTAIIFCFSYIHCFWVCTVGIEKSNRAISGTTSIIGGGDTATCCKKYETEAKAESLAGKTYVLDSPKLACFGPVFVSR